MTTGRKTRTVVPQSLLTIAAAYPSPREHKRQELLPEDAPKLKPKRYAIR